MLQHLTYAFAKIFVAADSKKILERSSDGCWSNGGWRTPTELMGRDKSIPLKVPGISMGAHTPPSASHRKKGHMPDRGWKVIPMQQTQKKKHATTIHNKHIWTLLRHHIKIFLVTQNIRATNIVSRDELLFLTCPIELKHVTKLYTVLQTQIGFYSRQLLNWIWS